MSRHLFTNSASPLTSGGEKQRHITFDCLAFLEHGPQLATAKTVMPPAASLHSHLKLI